MQIGGLTPRKARSEAGRVHPPSPHIKPEATLRIYWKKNGTVMDTTVNTLRICPAFTEVQLRRDQES